MTKRTARLCSICGVECLSSEVLVAHVKAQHGLTILPPRLPRPSWPEVWREVAHTISTRSTCPRKQVGCVIVDDGNRVLSTGYNGAPAGEPHCTDVGCDLDEAGHCARAVHAEVNAILTCSGRAKGATVYLTHFPCPACCLLLVQAGISTLNCPAPPDKPRYTRAMKTLMSRGINLHFEEA